MSSLELLTPPAAEPLTRAEAKAWLRVETADDDALIDALIAAARRAVEDGTGRALRPQRWRYWRDAWPRGPGLALPRPPLRAVEAVETFGADGAPVLWPAANYVADRGEPAGRLVRVAAAWPQPGRPAHGIAIAFEAGWDAIPPSLLQAVRLLLAQFYERREPALSGGLPADVAALLAPWRVRRL